jgi:hypothetical protein
MTIPCPPFGDLGCTPNHRTTVIIPAITSPSLLAKLKLEEIEGSATFVSQLKDKDL